MKVSSHVTGTIVRQLQERKQIEEERDRILNLSMDLICVAGMDGYFKYLNPAWEKILGYTIEELLTRPFLDFIHPDDHVKNDNEVKNLSANKKTMDFENRYIANNGSIHTISWIATPLVSEGLIYCIGRDITDRKVAEDALRQSEERHAEAQSIAHIGHWELNLITNELFWSDETYKIFEIDKDKFGVSYEAFLDTVHPDDREYVNKVYIDSVKNKTEYNIVHRCLFESGRIKYVNERCRTECDEQGNPTRSIGTTQDITSLKKVKEEKKSLENKLCQAQKMEAIGTLAGGIAHDFNNILFPILGHAEMLIDDIPQDSELSFGINEIYAGALRARGLVKQILTFSRQENSELRLMRVQPPIKEVLKLIRSTIPTTIDIKHDIQADCGVIKADPTQIHQIVMNLITNAYHAMKDTGGELKVCLKEVELKKIDLLNPDMNPGLYALLSVIDKGIGMDKELTEKIFDPFFTTKETGKGTGLGLSVVHGIVKSMNGAIEVYSEPGIGTEFNVYFPVEKKYLAKNKIQTKDPIQGGKENILLIDDEESIVIMEKRLLIRLGYQVTFCVNSIEALELFRSNPDNFDLVITDMAMPGLPGDKLSVALNQIRPDIPVLLCTGFSENMSEEKAASLGIKGFLMKPVVVKDLAHKIREVLDDAKGSTQE
ncbi:MAG: PAS domain-containing protein [Desulfobacteraceae bacterium]|nr:PAS domain-containing protein [Desulfobacteraceae bacterium]